MVYKKYIKRDGKIYGPYKYHSRKINGKVITEYRGKAVKKKKINTLFLIIGIILVFSLVFFALNYDNFNLETSINSLSNIKIPSINPLNALTGFAISETFENESVEEVINESEPVQEETEETSNETITEVVNETQEESTINESVIEGLISNITDITQINETVNETISEEPIQFDGIDDYIDSGNNSNLNFGTGDFTVEAWFKLSSYPPVDNGYGYPIVQKVNTDYDDGWYLWVRNTAGETNLKFGIFGGGIGQIDNLATIELELDTWYHAVGVKGTNYSKIYLNGVEEHSSTHSSVNSDSAENLLIGTWIDFGSFFNGTIDEVRIFNRSLSADEVTALYEQRLTQGAQSIFDLKIVQREIKE